MPDFTSFCSCGHVYDEHDPVEDGCAVEGCDCFIFELAEDEDETRVDLGGGMVVPLRELLEDDDA